MIRPGDLVAVQRRLAVDVFVDDSTSTETLGVVCTGAVGLVVCLTRTTWRGCLIVWSTGLVGWSTERAIAKVLG